MIDPARRALDAAEDADDPAVRRLWLVAAIEAIIGRPVVVVGGTAVDFHTGGYQATDIDLVGAVSKADKQALIDAGFDLVGSRYLAWPFRTGDRQLIEFPDGVLDGTLIQVALDEGVIVKVISLESLVVDRLEQVTDRTLVTFEEAVRLVVATAERIDWSIVVNAIDQRPLRTVMVELTRRVLIEAGELDSADRWFAPRS
jgi:hypothetical protein